MKRCFVVRLKFAFIGKKYPNKLGFFGATGKNGFSGGSVLKMLSPNLYSSKFAI